MIFDKLYLKSGTTAGCDKYKGAAGEVVFDEDREAIRVYTKSTLQKGGKVVANVDDLPTLVSDIFKDFLASDETQQLLHNQFMTLNKVYPVGSIFFNLNDIDPAVVLGGGTWVKISQGRVLVGAGTYTQGSEKTTYNAGNQGGERTHVITSNELTSHTHVATATADGEHDHGPGSMEILGKVGIDGYVDGEGDDPHNYSGALSRTTDVTGTLFNGEFTSNQRMGIALQANATNGSWTGRTEKNGIHEHTISVDPAGSNAPMSLMQPYLVVHMWQRTA